MGFLQLVTVTDTNGRTVRHCNWGSLFLPNGSGWTIVRISWGSSQSSVRLFRVAVVSTIALIDTPAEIFRWTWNIPSFNHTQRRHCKVSSTQSCGAATPFFSGLVHTHRHRNSAHQSLTLCQWLTGRMGLEPIQPEFQSELIICKHFYWLSWLVDFRAEIFKFRCRYVWTRLWSSGPCRKPHQSDDSALMLTFGVDGP